MTKFYEGVVTGSLGDEHIVSDLLKAGATILGSTKEENSINYDIRISQEDMHEKLDNYWGRWIWSLELKEE